MKKYILVTLASTLFLSLNAFSSTFMEENQMVESTFRPALDKVEKLQTKLSILEQEIDFNTEVRKFIQELIKYQSLNQVDKIKSLMDFKLEISKLRNLGQKLVNIQEQLISLDSEINVLMGDGTGVGKSHFISEYMIKNNRTLTAEDAKNGAQSLALIYTYQNKYIKIKNRLDSLSSELDALLLHADAEFESVRKFTPY